MPRGVSGIWLMDAIGLGRVRHALLELQSADAFNIESHTSGTDGALILQLERDNVEMFSMVLKRFALANTFLGVDKETLGGETKGETLCSTCIPDPKLPLDRVVHVLKLTITKFHRRNTSKVYIGSTTSPCHRFEDTA